jgi:DNA polymerase-3 subunit beta
VTELDWKGETKMETTFKATVSRRDLVKALQLVKRAVPCSPVIVGLSYVLLSVSDDGLSLTGTDMDIAIQTTVGVEYPYVAGQCVVECKKLLELSKSIKSDTVTLETAWDKINIQAGGSGFCLPLGELDEFPPVVFEEHGNEKGQVVLSDEVVTVAKKALRFVADDRTRIVLTGVFFELGDDSATVTATNGSILATYNVPNNVGTGTKHEFILPAPAVKLLTDKHSEPWAATVYDRKVVFRSGDTVVSTKLIDAPYPNYRQVIPQGTLNTQFIADRAELSQAVEGVLPCANVINHKIVFEFGHNSEKPDKLVLSAENPDTGSKGSDTITGNLSGDDLRVAYNGKLTKHILDSVDAERIQWATDDWRSGAVVTPQNENEPGLYLIMPLRLDLDD